VLFPEELTIRRPSKGLAPVPGASATPMVRRKTSDIRIPGAYIEQRYSFNQDRNLDEHLRKIEVAYVTRRQSTQNLRYKISARSDRTLQHRTSTERTLQHKTSIQSNCPLQHKFSIQSGRSLQHKASMHSERSVHRRSSVQLPDVDELEKRSPPLRVGSKSKYRGQKSFHRTDTIGGAKQVRPATSHPADPVRGDFEKITPFRRLSLGDVSPGFGNIGKMFE
jgi:hypothetical protein